MDRRVCRVIASPGAMRPWLRPARRRTKGRYHRPSPGVPEARTDPGWGNPNARALKDLIRIPTARLFRPNTRTHAGELLNLDTPYLGRDRPTLVWGGNRIDRLRG